jgi:selenocysteine-specific elongation factor
MHVIATAGHVDHGKSTLIRGLTGMEPDRWAEERRRGLTIDLGYAWTTLPDGTQVAFVDVPGHHRFVTNMLAGVGPVPAVLFVVAADQGWSAQSTEHLDALKALDVRHGVLAISRCDLGDAELAESEARDYLAGSPLADLEAVPVSPVAGIGMDALGAALVRMTRRMPAPVPGRLGCGSTAYSLSAAPAPSSPARLAREPCASATRWRFGRRELP